MDLTNPPTPADRLREHGLRVTSQRRAILEVFGEGGRGHLSADEIHESVSGALPELARATVYNTLNEFVRAGLVRRIEGFGSALYDGNLNDSHHHFHCVGCGRLFDVEPDGAGAIGLPEQGFEIERTEILFRGRCADCAGSVVSL